MDMRSVTEKCKAAIAFVREEPEAQAFLRTVALGAMVGAFLVFAAQNLYLNPKNKAYTKKIAKKKELTELVSVLSANLRPADEEHKRQQRLSSLEEELGINTVKADILSRASQELADPERFNRIILALTPLAPAGMDQSIRQVTSGEPMVHDGFVIHPVTLEGRAEFSLLLRYLHFLENRQEVGLLDSLHISQAAPEGGAETETVNFKLRLGRIETIGK